MANWLPNRETDLLPFVTNFAQKIQAALTSYGLTAPEAVALSSLVGAFSQSLATALNPTTRTKTTIAAKDLAKAQVVATVRSYAKRIQANPAVTVTQRTDLGLPAAPAPRVPVPPPGSKPILALMATEGRSHLIRLTDITTPDKRARPAGVAGAEVYSFVPTAPGETPPPDLEKWRFEGIATRADFEVDYDAGDIGKTATIVARWFNPRGEPGPMSNPITGTVAA